MDYKELLDKLGVGDSEPLDDFEYFAFLMEADEEIEIDALVGVLGQFSKNILLEINENYFHEILRILPDEDVSLYAHIESIKRHFDGMIKEEDLKESYRLAEDIYAFREWYSIDQNAFILDDNQWVGISLRDCLTQRILDEIEGADGQYRFDEYSEFPMDDYFVDLLILEEEDYEDYDVEILGEDD